MASKVSTSKFNRFEAVAWQYMRWSGVLLIPLVLIHLGIVHIINSVYDINADWVAIRWANLGWRIYDAALLWFAGLHGLNGLRYVVDDYFPNRKVRRAIKGAAVVVLGFVFVLGSITLIGGVSELPGS